MKAIFTGANKYATLTFDETQITLLLETIETVGEMKAVNFNDLRSAISHELKITITGMVVPQN